MCLRVGLTLLSLPVLTACTAPLDPTSLLLAGNWAALLLQRGSCPRPASLDGHQTPVELYRSMRACLHRSDPDTAALLFALAAAYGRYDSLRVADPRAHRASTRLRLGALEQLSDPQRQALAAGVAAVLADPGRRPDLCAAIERIGPPSYSPDYLLAHGRMALSRAAGPGVRPPRMPASVPVQPFDGSAAWNQVLDTVLRCDKT